MPAGYRPVRPRLMRRMSHGDCAEHRPIATPRVLIAVGASLVVVIAASFGLFGVLWHRSALDAVVNHPGGWAGGISVFVCGAVVHELLHALAWKISGRVPWRSLCFRRSRRKLGVVAGVSVPLRAFSYRFGLLVPAFLLGVLPLASALMTGSGLLSVWGAVFLFESFSDIAGFAAVRKVPPHRLVLDHPRKPSRRDGGGGVSGRAFTIEG